MSTKNDHLVHVAKVSFSMLCALLLTPQARSADENAVPMPIAASQSSRQPSGTIQPESESNITAVDYDARPVRIPRTTVPKSPYKAVFFDNDFSYLDGQESDAADFFDHLKRISPVNDLLIDLGGEYRLRFHDERNMRLTGRNEDFTLHRTRLYGDLRYRKTFRAYAEFIDAASFGEELPTRPIYVNRADFLNLFGEVAIWSEGSEALTARIGRQELLYGSQRLISPLDWANTRRTFDGAKVFWKGADWNVDAFWTRPVAFAQHVPEDHNFDNPDESQQFYGLFSTFRGIDGHTFDAYYLGFRESDAPRTGIAFENHTFGARWEGSFENWLWEVEGGYQFGSFAALDQSAGFYTLGAGRRFAGLPWTPTIWAYFDWASGDSDPTDGDRGTFNHLFPFGHYYLGAIDLVARQNIEDLNFKLTFKPHAKATVVLWWHIYRLQQARDALYNAGGAISRFDPTGAAGTDVGNELDLILKFQIDAHADLLFGYSRLFSGKFIRTTGTGRDAEFFYTQFGYRF